MDEKIELMNNTIKNLFKKILHILSPDAEFVYVEFDTNRRTPVEFSRSETYMLAVGYNTSDNRYTLNFRSGEFTSRTCLTQVIKFITCNILNFGSPRVKVIINDEFTVENYLSKYDTAKEYLNMSDEELELLIRVGD